MSRPKKHEICGEIHPWTPCPGPLKERSKNTRKYIGELNRKVTIESSIPFGSMPRDTKKNKDKNMSKNSLKTFKVTFTDGSHKLIRCEIWGPEEGFAYFTIRHDFEAEIIFSCPMTKIDSVELLPGSTKPKGPPNHDTSI